MMNCSGKIWIKIPAEIEIEKLYVFCNDFGCIRAIKVCCSEPLDKIVKIEYENEESCEKLHQKLNDQCLFGNERKCKTLKKECKHFDSFTDAFFHYSKNYNPKKHFCFEYQQQYF